MFYWLSEPDSEDSPAWSEQFPFEVKKKKQQIIHTTHPMKRGKRNKKKEKSRYIQYVCIYSTYVNRDIRKLSSLGEEGSLPDHFGYRSQKMWIRSPWNMSWRVAATLRSISSRAWSWCTRRIRSHGALLSPGRVHSAWCALLIFGLTCSPSTSISKLATKSRVVWPCFFPSLTPANLKFCL